MIVSEDSPYDTQAETRPGLLRREVRFENAGLGFARYAAAVIGNLEPHVLTGWEFRAGF
jgi:hypothetical protein